LALAHLAFANADNFAFAAALIVGFFAGDVFLAGAEAPLFFAAHFAFIRAESLALAAADIGLRPEETVAFGADVSGLPALTFAQRALAAARSLALVASDMPELVDDLGADAEAPKVEESSACSFSICSLSCTARLSWPRDKLDRFDIYFAEARWRMRTSQLRFTQGIAEAPFSVQ
jgi:hypothetical protein